MVNYENINNIMKFDKNGKIIFKTVYFPKIEKKDDDIVIITKDYERLDILASKYYGNPTYWRIIAHANNLYGTMRVPPDTQIFIPININQILQDFISLNEF